jgi:hypothetical protein
MSPTFTIHSALLAFNSAASTNEDQLSSSDLIKAEKNLNRKSFDHYFAA